MSKHGNKMMHMHSTEFIADYVLRFSSSPELSQPVTLEQLADLPLSCSHLLKTQKIKGQSFFGNIKKRSVKIMVKTEKIKKYYLIILYSFLLNAENIIKHVL